MAAIQSLDALMEAARQARKRSYAPYSHYSVGAAIRGSDGRIYAGCNVENAAYPQGTCAEAGAIAAMVLGGGVAIAEVVVAGPPGRPCTPCGGCRQKLREFGRPCTAVHVCDPDALLLSTTIGELLPYDFGADNLDSATDGDRPE